MNACSPARCVVVNPPVMSRKYRPYGLFCFLTSSISICRSLRIRTPRCVDSTIRLRLPRNHFQPRLPPAVPVRLLEALDRRARHQERLQHALIHRRDRLRPSRPRRRSRTSRSGRCRRSCGASGRRPRDRKSGSTLVPTLLVKVWPSLSSFCRWPSTRWPKISWKNTPAARPEKIAGPDERLGLGRLQQLGDIVGHAVDRRQQHLVVRQPRRRPPLRKSRRCSGPCRRPPWPMPRSTTRAKPRPCCDARCLRCSPGTACPSAPNTDTCEVSTLG